MLVLPLVRLFRAGLSHAAATRLNLGRPKRPGTQAQGLKPTLLHARDAALKGPLFHGAADFGATLKITPLSTSAALDITATLNITLLLTSHKLSITPPGGISLNIIRYGLKPTLCQSSAV